MKHILFGLAAVLFASSAALADDPAAAQEKAASAAPAQSADSNPAKPSSGAAVDHATSPETAVPAGGPSPTASAGSASPAGERGIGPFSLGMSQDEAKALGAKPTDNADMLQLPYKWMEADWTCVVQFQEGKAAAVILYADMGDPLLARIFGDLRARGCMPITVQPAMGHADLYQLAAQGKSDDECWTAMRKRLNVFSTATEGACSVLFTTQGFFKALAATVKEPSQEEAILTGHTADPVYAVNIDMSANQLTYLVTSWGFISK